MNVFVPKGFLTIPETTLRLADPSQSDREVALKEAREPLHQGLGGGSVEFVIQMPTGEHLVPPPDIWRSSNSLNWIVDGKVFVPDGTVLRVPFGPYVPGLPDDVNFAEMDGGTWAIFLIVEDSLERFRGRVARAEKIERLGSTLGETKSNSRAILRNEMEEEFRAWRKNFKSGQPPTHDQDVKHIDGARLRFAYLERDADADMYQGHNYTRVYVEEIGNFPSPAPVMKLMATLRSGAGVPVGLRATGNPGGPGHQWVRQRYIDPAPLGNRIIRDPLTGLERVFIPSRVDNNQHIDVEAYKQRLRASGSQELVRAWLDGDWSVTMGAFFDCWNGTRHIVPPFVIPKDWLRFRSMDWGSASPFSVGWWAIVQDDHALTNGGVVLPRGCMVRYREWYGMRPGEPNVGLKLHAEEVGKGIAEREQGETVAYGVLDPSAFKEDGGPSIAERIARGSGGKVWFRHADNTRVPARGAMGGWDQVRSRLVGDGDGRPMIVTFATCTDSIRTIPILQHDPDRPEDVMTDSEDHAGDEWRYACMSRPWVLTKDAPKPENISGYRPYRTDEQPGDWLTY